jgi:serine/threonine protein kinase
MKAGDRVLDYVVDRELGEGGMGKVYLARHTVLDQQVALKVLDPEVSRKPDVRERFIQEANIQAKLRHPGIVQVLTATQAESGTPVLVMEYVSGKSLAEVVEKRGPLPVDDALKVMERILSAVSYAHQQGVIHRDLKPSNVMVMASGETKVTDFGIAKVLGSARLTRTGTAMGSAHYMSPEQIRRPETVDARSDIYSLGCMFYEILTGRPPFANKEEPGADSDFEIKTAHVNEIAPEPSRLNKNIPAWLDAFIMQSLEKDASRRQSSCEEMLAQTVVGEARPSSPRGSSRPTVIVDRTQQPPRPSNFRVTLVGALAGAAVMGVLVFFGNFFTGINATKKPESHEIEKISDASASRAKDIRQRFSQPDTPTTTNDEYQKNLEKKTVDTVTKLLATFSESDEKSYAFLENVLAGKVFFYGQSKPKNEILKEKLNFMGKWNSRDYVGRRDTYKTQCDLNANRCVISGVLDWKAVSTASNLLSQGSASFEYGVDFSDGEPQIYMESGKVLKRELSNL